MREEQHWQPVEVLWDEEQRTPPTQALFPFQREQRLPLMAPPPPQERPRQARSMAERPERRAEQPNSRRGKSRPKQGRKKLRAQDFDDLDDV